MTWAGTDIIPTQINLSGLYSQGAAAFGSDSTVRLQCKTSSGANFDFTAASAAVAFGRSGIGIPAAFEVATTVAPTIVSADATGITLLFSAAAMKTLLTATGVTSLPLMVQATDGTTVLTIASGSLSARVVP